MTQLIKSGATSASVQTVGAVTVTIATLDLAAIFAPLALPNNIELNIEAHFQGFCSGLGGVLLVGWQSFNRAGGVLAADVGTATQFSNGQAAIAGASMTIDTVVADMIRLRANGVLARTIDWGVMWTLRTSSF